MDAESPAVVRRIVPAMYSSIVSGFPQQTRAVDDVLRVEGSSSERVCEEVVVEEPLEIRLVFGPADRRCEKSVSVTMRTPGHDAELAAGFLLTEGVVADADDLASVEPVAPTDEATHNAVRVAVLPGVAVNQPTLERNFYMTSGCGVCGRASLLALETIAPSRRQNTFLMDAAVLQALPTELKARQELFARTGGLHGAALVNRGGEPTHRREDVGRHNAVDKLIGAAAMDGRLPLRESALLLSGRVSFDLMQKAVMAGIPMVIAIGAPSSLAVDVARRFDITLVAFLREDHFNIYHGFSRVLHASAG